MQIDKNCRKIIKYLYSIRDNRDLGSDEATYQCLLNLIGNEDLLIGCIRHLQNDQYILTNISQSETDFRKHRFCISTLGSAIYENEKELKSNEKVNLLISLIGCVTGIIGMITGIIALFC